MYCTAADGLRRAVGFSTIAGPTLFVKKGIRRSVRDIFRGTMRNTLLLVLCSILLSTVPLFSQNGTHDGTGDSEPVEFRYRYLDGEHYRILSRVDSEAFVDGQFNHREEVLNRIAVDVEALDDGRGQLRVQYQVSREGRVGSGAFALGREYEVQYIRDQLGLDEVPAGSSRPMVRNVPLFPERALQIGDTWSGQGVEVVDLRESFGIDAVEEFAIPVSYEYVGVEQDDGRTFDIFELEYNMFYRIPGRFTGLYPQRISGYSRQRHKWDREFGRPHAYEEEFEINYDLSDGTTWTWRGTAEARITDTSFSDRQQILRELRERIEGPDLSVREDERGVTISLENIGFEPDSTRLRPGEEEKLAAVAEILLEYDRGELLITGHTALAGTAEGRRRLSEARARVIADYMLDRNVRPSDAIFYRGMGADEPVADNATEAGRRRNRRVEFTILD